MRLINLTASWVRVLLLVAIALVPVRAISQTAPVLRETLPNGLRVIIVRNTLWTDVVMNGVVSNGTAQVTPRGKVGCNSVMRLRTLLATASAFAFGAADGLNEDVRLFEEDELRRRLERWFFDHS